MVLLTFCCANESFRMLNEPLFPLNERRYDSIMPMRSLKACFLSAKTWLLCATHSRAGAQESPFLVTTLG